MFAVDNLCQFLPQDKVQEFSEMDSQVLTYLFMTKVEPLCSFSSQRLLVETQLALVGQPLVAKQEKLVELSSSKDGLARVCLPAYSLR
jgi:hypothetical protein